jgi:hypothetical protein
MNNSTKIGLLLLPLMVVVTTHAGAQAGKTETPYAKLFKDKAVKTQRGLITLHKLEGKVYFELPLKLLGKDMLLGSVAEATSNSDDAAAGEQAHDPLCIYFAQADSSVQIRKRFFTARADSSESSLQKALVKNNADPVIASFKILAVTPDSLSLVFDVTPFFVNGSVAMDPFMPVGGLYSRNTLYRAENSLLHDIMAWRDNVCISSYLSYSVTNAIMGLPYSENRPATILMKRSLVLLPEQPMRARLSDPRIGVFYTGYEQYSGNDNGVKPIYYANRWRLEPADMAAYQRGELVKPITPITFYIDDKFPQQWMPYIAQGVHDWNKAFERIGFKQAIVTKPYPTNDTAFDPNNIKYNCIKYAPTLTQNAMGPSWVDPRTGEILNASVYVYHGIADVLNNWMFVQMSAADKRARTMHMPQELMGRGIRYVIAHEVGHCLGLMHNMGASSAFPVDSLRSPTFTAKYGTTPSIMDYARFNFIAQPGDVERGVQMTPPELGVYDYYAIKWLYQPIYTARTTAEETAVLEKWISEKIGDPMYRYGKQQLGRTIDPHAQTEDLGDDQVKATRYMMKNMQFIMQNMDQWVDATDTDYGFRSEMNFAIINIHFYWYWMHVLSNVGGIYMYEKHEGDPFPAYKVVPKPTQKESVLFLLESLEHLSWMNNKQVEGHMNRMNGDAAGYIRSALFPYMMLWVAHLGFSETKAGAGAYTQAECVNDVFNYVWGSAMAGKKPTAEKLSMQTALVNLLIRNSRVLEKPGAGAAAVNGAGHELADAWSLPVLNGIDSKNFYPGCMHAGHITGDVLKGAGAVSGVGFFPGVKYQATDIAHIYYGWLLRCKDILQKLTPSQTGEVKLQYQYLLAQINKSLKITN